MGRFRAALPTSFSAVLASVAEAGMRLSLVMSVVVLLLAGAARAQTIECTHDTDCNADSVCGGLVCNYLAPGTDQRCQAATGAALEGHCLNKNDCKCKASGAECTSSHCTITVPPGSGADLAPGAGDLASAASDLAGVTLDLTTTPGGDDLATPTVTEDLSAPVQAPDLTSSVGCDVDKDCAINSCGGLVCRKSGGAPECVAAGTDAEGSDGACESDFDCKCFFEGATCGASGHCSHTISTGREKAGCAVSGSSGATALFVMLALGALAQLRRRRGVSER